MGDIYSVLIINCLRVSSWRTSLFKESGKLTKSFFLLGNSINPSLLERVVGSTRMEQKRIFFIHKKKLMRRSRKILRKPLLMISFLIVWRVRFLHRNNNRKMSRSPNEKKKSLRKNPRKSRMNQKKKIHKRNRRRKLRKLSQLDLNINLSLDFSKAPVESNRLYLAFNNT